MSSFLLFQEFSNNEYDSIPLSQEIGQHIYFTLNYNEVVSSYSSVCLCHILTFGIMFSKLYGPSSAAIEMRAKLVLLIAPSSVFQIMPGAQ